MPTYGSIITNAGDALLAAALVPDADPIALATIVVGDANGTEVLPSPTQTALINQRYQVSIASLSVDSENPNQIIATAVIPAEIGGFDIREIGIKTLDGVLFAVGNFSAARKPVAAEGSVWVMELSIAIAIASTSAITLVVDPEIDYATKQWVIDNFEPLGSGGAFVPITRIISAGPGLTGGGSLAQNRSFAADEAWFNARFSSVEHLHDGRYALIAHLHAIAIANGAAGFMSGADKAKLDGLGPAGLRLLATTTGGSANFIDMTLPGPFDAIIWQIAWGPLSETVSSVSYNTRVSGRIQNSPSGFPAIDESSYPFQMGMQQIDGGGYGGNGAGLLFANGMSLRHRSDYTPDFPAQAFTPPTTGQNRHLRIACFSSASPGGIPFGATVKVWGF